MHKEAYTAAREIEPESSAAAAELAKSIIMGWKIDGKLWEEFVKKARNLKDAAPDWEQQQEKLRETEQRVVPDAPTGDDIPF